MSRYTGPQWRISRRLGFSTLENGKELNRRAYAPGQHGTGIIVKNRVPGCHFTVFRIYHSRATIRRHIIE